MEDQKGYGKGYGSNWKKWLWIYLVVAVVLYGGYYFYKVGQKTDSNSTDSSSPSNSIY